MRLEMQYLVSYNQLRAIEWDLTIIEAIIFGYIANSTCGDSSWIKKSINGPEGGKLFYLSKNKILTELPTVVKSKTSLQRHLRILEKKGLIIRYAKNRNQLYLGLTEEGKKIFDLVSDDEINELKQQVINAA